MNENPRGIRNNNPGNIRAGTYKFAGQTGIDNAYFRIFDTPENGIQALESLLQRYQSMGTNTIRLIINKYAPPVENDTNNYVRIVSVHTGILPDTQLDLVHDKNTLIELCKAIILVENGVQPYSDEQF